MLSVGNGDPTIRPVPDLPNGEILSNVVYIDCEATISGAVTLAGSLYMWGKSSYLTVTSSPTLIATAVATVSIGSMYAGYVSTAGELYTWGYGGHGNLGHDNLKSYTRPKVVDFFTSSGVNDVIKVAMVSCTRGQEGMKGGVNPRGSGCEGPHTNVLSSAGLLYTFGTAHKGLLLNLSKKTGAFNGGFDQSKPYRVGDEVSNERVRGHVDYDHKGPFIFTVSAHIHGGVVAEDGSAYAWGCGSNDGRCGVVKFLTGLHGGIDRMKCYLMGLERVGIDEGETWKENEGLQGKEVMRCASGRNTMAWIVK